MSAKFKPGDIVEVLSGDHSKMNGIFPGMQGTIVKYIGEGTILRSDGTRGTIRNAWCVDFPTHKNFGVNECLLKLVPGNQDCRDISTWDTGPWNPYNERNKHAIENIESLKKNPFNTEYDF